MHRRGRAPTMARPATSGPPLAPPRARARDPSPLPIPMSKTLLLLVAAAVLAALTIVTSCATGAGSQARAPGSIDVTMPGEPPLGSRARHDLVQTSAFCGKCHPAQHAEHAMNTHGRAFTDPEVRLATGNFDHGDCIRCHTPRPIFETGIGLNPQRRYHNLVEGNTCMTCHWREGVDYSRFVGGPDCKEGFDPRVGTVEACATCHRNHGTPYQWEVAPNGKLAGKTCMSCHMELIERPVATGGPVRRVRSHVFPGARSESQLRKAYAYEARIDGNEVVVTIANEGAGHNFPTELKQRSVESLVVVRDLDGKEVARSRVVFRDPYKRPYGLHLLVNTQIPSGESREHRVPLTVAGGTVDCELHFKHYFPIEDHHPELARRLELRRLSFDGITPSDKPVTGDPEVRIVVPEGISIRDASVADLVDFARPPIGKTEITVPEGSTPDDIARLIELFQFPLAEANRLAQGRLVKIGLPAVPALIEALGSWDNKTFNQAMAVLRRIGAPAVPAVRAALRHEQLYVRMHARMLLETLPVPADKAVLVTEVAAGLGMSNALDRRSTADLLRRLGATEQAPALRALLQDIDADVVAAAGRALAVLGDREAVPAITAAMEQASFAETRADLAAALAELGSTNGIPELLRQLDHPDLLLRERAFELFFGVTGLHKGYEPALAETERLAAIAALTSWWAQNGGVHVLRRPYRPEPGVDDHAFHVVSAMGGGAGVIPAAEDDEKAIQELVDMGSDALPALLKGLKFPAGFAAKRASICTALGRMGEKNAAPFLMAALKDPVVGVAAYANMALASCGDADCLPALERFQDRVLSLHAAGQLPASVDRDLLLAQIARTRLILGYTLARADLVNALLSDSRPARAQAIAALQERFGESRGYDPDASAEDRRAAQRRWQQ